MSVLNQKTLKKSLKFEIYSEIKGSIWFSCEKISEKKISN